MAEEVVEKGGEVKPVEYIGFIRYEGHSLEDGYFDARKSARALMGLDSALRYFIAQQDDEFAKTDYPIPVRIRKGSWEALIPDNIGVLIGGAIAGSLTVAATRYLMTAADTLAKNDFKDVTTRELFKRAMQAMQWILRVGDPEAGPGGPGGTVTYFEVGA